MKRYLLDTNICIFFLRGKYDVNKKINRVGIENCCVSEVSVAELECGVECSSNKQRNAIALEQILDAITIIPLCDAIKQYAKEKARLKISGTPVDDFDLLIASTAIANNMTLVTDNTKHFARIEGLTLENWIER